MFDRLELMIGDKAKTLEEKTILLIGLGGVGGYTFESLVRSGIGTIIVADSDVFSETNLNRQLLCLNNNLGNYKVDEAEKRKDLINPKCKIIKIKDFITKENIEKLFEHKIDFLIDAEDSMSVKKQIIKECLLRKVKCISVMGTGNKMDASKLEITELKNTTYDPVAKEIRIFLSRQKITEPLTVVASSEIPLKKGKVGSNAFVPGVAGLLCTNYVINQLIKED